MTKILPSAESEPQSLLKRLLKILQAEYAAAKTSDAERLATLTQEKTVLIEVLGRFTGKDPNTQQSASVLQLLKQCRQQNEANGQILQIGLRNAQRLHNILRGSDGLPSSYDGYGEPTFSPQQGTPLAKI